MAEHFAPSEHRRNLMAKAISEFKRLVAIILYLWVIFGLYVLNETVILTKQHIDFSAHGFAIINAFVLAKVLLVAEDLGFGARFKDRPLVYPILYKALAFSILFIVFHICESVLGGLWHGKSAVESIPQIGGGTLKGIFCVIGIIFVSLIPFFAFREVGRIIGEDELWGLIFKRRTTEFTLHSVPPQ